MSQLFTFLIIGVLFVLVLLVWALRTKGSGASLRETAEGSNSLELPSSRALAERIFAAQDWEFVSSQAQPEIQRTFLQERGNLALSWLRQTRRQAAQLMEFHLRAVRQNTELRPSVEMRLAANYLTLLFLHGLLHVLIRVRGPFRARQMAGYAMRVAEQLSALSGKLLGADRGLASKVNAAWTDKSS